MANITLKKILKDAFSGLSIFALSVGACGAGLYGLNKLTEGAEIYYNNNKIVGYRVSTIDGMTGIISRKSHFIGCTETISVGNIFDIIHRRSIDYTDKDCDGIVDSITISADGVNRKIDREKGDKKIFQDADKEFKRLREEFIQPKLEEKLKN